jgi:hypothetical protein
VNDYLSNHVFSNEGINVTVQNCKFFGEKCSAVVVIRHGKLSVTDSEIFNADAHVVTARIEAELEIKNC